MKVRSKEVSVHLGSYPGGGKGDQPVEASGTEIRLQLEDDRLGSRHDAGLASLLTPISRLIARREQTASATEDTPRPRVNRSIAVSRTQTCASVRHVSDPIEAIEHAILDEAQAMLRALTRELDARVRGLVAERRAPIGRNEARRFMADFRRGELV